MPRPWRTAAAAVISTTLSAALLAGAGPAHAADVLTLTFYDSAGAVMSGQAAYDLMRNKADNLGNGYQQKIVLALVEAGGSLADNNPANVPLTPAVAGNTLQVTLPSGTPTGLAATWPTSGTRGYSQVELDNGGAGYTGSASVNFTYRAALDAKRRFELAVTSRTGATPAYVPSTAFTNARTTLNTDYAAMTSAGTESERGRLGWKVLDGIHKAGDILLAEYGPQLAKYKDEHDQGSPWLGTTFDDATNSNTNTRLGYARNATLPAGASPNPRYGWVRLVFDLENSPADYDAAVRNAHDKGLLVLGMPFDSTTARACAPVSNPTGCTVAQYKARYTTYLNHFGNQSDARLNIDAWEVGNEVNGEWIDTDPVSGTYSYGSGQMAQKIAQTADLVHATTDKPVVVTLYWQTATSNYPRNSTYRWARDNLVTPGTAAKIDTVLLSAYIEDAPLGLGFDPAMSALHGMLPGSQIGLGEFDYFYTDTSRFFWSLTHLNSGSTQAQAQAARPALATQYYSAALAYPRSVGGTFWWYFQEESAGTAGTNLQNAIKGVANKVYSG